MQPVRKVALLVETSNSYARELLHGVRSWVRERGPWSIRLTEQGRGAAVPGWLQGWEGDGVIARVENAAIARGLRATGLPVIDVSAALPRLVFPRVATDAERAARLVATQLLDWGLKRLAYCGYRDMHWSRRRGEAFAATVRTAGGTWVLFSPPPGPVDAEIGAMAAWLQGLARPVGMLAAIDPRGQHILAACRLAGLSVPGEVAVIGVHNDELLCDLCDPPLLSVIPDAPRADYVAAGLLSKAMAGKRPAVVLHEIEPSGVASR